MSKPPSVRASRRTLLLALPFAPFAAHASTEARTLRIVLGFPPGTGPDLVARLLADGLRERAGTAVVVDNKPGAAGAIAAQEVARAPADGQTLLLGEVAQLAMAPSTYARLPYDPARDFAAVAHVASADFAFVVPPTLEAADLAAYVAWAKARSSVFLATFGAGTPGHFGAVTLAAERGFAAEAVHFRSTGDAMTALLKGDVQGMFGSVALVAPHVREGRLRALAVTGEARHALLPGVPTLAELGSPGLSFNSWFGLVAPAATPNATLASLEAGVLHALAAPSLRARLEEAGFHVVAQGRSPFASLIAAETARWAEIVRRTGFRAIE